MSLISRLKAAFTTAVSEEPIPSLKIDRVWNDLKEQLLVGEFYWVETRDSRGCIDVEVAEWGGECFWMCGSNEPLTPESFCERGGEMVYLWVGSRLDKPPVVSPDPNQQSLFVTP